MSWAAAGAEGHGLERNKFSPVKTFLGSLPKQTGEKVKNNRGNKNCQAREV